MQKQSAPPSRQITTPTPRHSIFTGRQSTEGTSIFVLVYHFIVLYFRQFLYMEFLIMIQVK